MFSCFAFVGGKKSLVTTRQQSQSKSLLIFVEKFGSPGRFFARWKLLRSRFVIFKFFMSCEQQHRRI